MGKLLGVLAGLLCLLAGAARAEDVLYGDQPSQKAIFVRFINALDTGVAVESDLLARASLGTTASDRIGAFAVIDRPIAPSLSITARAGGAELREKITLVAGTKVSIVLRRDKDGLHAKSFATAFELNPARTVLSFVNAAPGCGTVSLLLKPRDATIFADVPVDGARSRRINTVSAQIGATCGGLGAPLAKLERPEAGGAYSVWLLTLDGRPSLLLSEDVLPTWHP